MCITIIQFDICGYTPVKPSAHGRENHAWQYAKTRNTRDFLLTTQSKADDGERRKHFIAVMLPSLLPHLMGFPTRAVKTWHTGSETQRNSTRGGRMENRVATLWQKIQGCKHMKHEEQFNMSGMKRTGTEHLFLTQNVVSGSRRTKSSVCVLASETQT